MSTTTIRIEDELKARIAAVAEQSGQTSHAFILETIAQRVEQLELDEAFHRIADRRWARIAAGGKTVPWDQAKAYVASRAAAATPAKPAGRRAGPKTR